MFFFYFFFHVVTFHFYFLVCGDLIHQKKGVTLKGLAPVFFYISFFGGASVYTSTLLENEDVI